jgi:phospholipid/cholesterol/gamma-HCH transport system permease protein
MTMEKSSGYNLNPWMEKRALAAGRFILSNLQFIGYTVILLFTSLYYTKSFFVKRHEILHQMYNAGVKTFPVVSIVALFTGMVLSLQLGVELKEYGQQHLVGRAIIATLTREMSPFTAAIILIASVGASMAAELGTMKVSEEIDALELMSISPVRFLVMPRVSAMALMTPIVTIYITVLGMIGAAIVANTHLNVAYHAFYTNAMKGLHFKALYVGLLKGYVAGLVISGISCACGLRAENGALGVGQATRDSVVASFIMVLITGYIITEIFYGH